MSEEEVQQEEVVEGSTQEQPEESSEVVLEPAVEPPAEAKSGYDWTFEFKGEKREVPEEYRWVDDPEKAKELVDLYQSREALQYHKEQTGEYKQQLETYQSQLSEYEPVVEQVNQLRQWYQEGDHMRVLESLGYGKDQVLQLAQEYLQLEKMPEDQKRMYEQNRQATLEREQLMQQNEIYREQAEQQLASLTRMELDAALRDESAQRIAEAYDAQHGAGKFRELVIDQGQMMVNRLGRHVPPSELVPQVVSQFAPFLQSVGAQTQEQAEVGTPKPKVIPNVKGKSASIGRSTVNSIADLHKLRQERFGG